MWRNFSKPVRDALKRRLIAGVTLLAYLAGALGYPLPELLARSAHPCGQQVCGCASAEKCRAGGCGCSQQPAPAPEEDETPSCCKMKKGATPACCGKKSADGKTPSCCAKKKSPAPDKQTKKAKPLRWVIGIAAQKCRGGASHFLSGEVALPGPLPTVWLPAWPYCESVPVSESHLFVVAYDPSDPPPRSDAA